MTFTEAHIQTISYIHSCVCVCVCLKTSLNVTWTENTPLKLLNPKERVWWNVSNAWTKIFLACCGAPHTAVSAIHFSGCISSLYKYTTRHPLDLIYSKACAVKLIISIYGLIQVCQATDEPKSEFHH